MIGTNYNLYSGLDSIYNSYSKNKTSSSGSSQLFELMKSSASVNYENIYQAYNNLNKTTSSTVNAQQTYYAGIKKGSSAMVSSLNQLAGGNQAAISSNSSAMSVSGGQNLGSMSFSVLVKQVASGQINLGSAIDKDIMFDGTGTHSFEIESNGKAQQFSVRVGAKDTNEDVQRKMAEAINSGNVGVKASVEVADDGTSRIAISSNTTGENRQSRFEIRDVSGDIVSRTGAGDVAQQAQNAVYQINGGFERTSESNDVSLGRGVQAELKQATSSEIRVTKGTDQTALVDNVKAFVSGANELLSTAYNNAGNGSQRISNDMLSTIRTYSNDLSDVGISLNKEGYLTIDDDKLKVSASDGSLNKMFGERRGVSYGFANRMDRIASNIDRSPVAFSNDATSNLNTLSNYYSKNAESSFNFQNYNMYSNVGLLMNAFG